MSVPPVVMMTEDKLNKYQIQIRSTAKYWYEATEPLQCFSTNEATDCCGAFNSGGLTQALCACTYGMGCGTVISGITTGCIATCPPAGNPGCLFLSGMMTAGAGGLLVCGICGLCTAHYTHIYGAGCCRKCGCNNCADGYTSEIPPQTHFRVEPLGMTGDVLIAPTVPT